ncbi:type IV pilin [Haloarcula taiwanensis]|uniref:Type IV pilin n=1 Tax=Haloarcula taiwanensis TaxID=1932004 RepID=A0A2H5A114_9EURY|nr:MULTISPECIES: type IV pilin N-terminal domain-containing protein [Haloarcula]AUG48377.1 type IV pilin [Haloarcula taiwanensis]RLM97079.1 type IV pilin [Haloarcula sp. Atlit-7R]
MRVKESWNNLGTAGKVLVGIGVSMAVLVILIPIIIVVSAVIASFVLGMGSGGGDVSVAPQASFSFEHEQTPDGVVTVVTHDGGETISAEQLTIEVTDGQTVGWDDDDGRVTVGDQSSVNVEGGTEVSLVWHGDDQTTVLARSTAPANES